MPRVYELPTHLQVEDQLIAGLTARQLVRLLVGASLAYGVWDQATWLAQDIRLLFALLIAPVAALFALLEPSTRAHRTSVPVLDIGGAEPGPPTADDPTQEELPAGRAQFLTAQITPFQVLVRAEPVDLDGHLRRVQARAAGLPDALRAIALDYVSFLPTLGQQRTLLERHCYLVLPDRCPDSP